MPARWCTCKGRIIDLPRKSHTHAFHSPENKPKDRLIKITSYEISFRSQHAEIHGNR